MKMSILDFLMGQFYLLSGSLVNVFSSSNEAILLLDVYMVATGGSHHEK